MSDVLLVVPPYYYKTKVLTSSVKEYAGVAYLAAVLRTAGHDVDILDADLAGYDPDETVTKILEKDASLIGLTMLQVAANPAIHIIRKIREARPDCTIAVGGHFPTFAREELLSVCPDVDFIVLGEGEGAFLEATEAVLGGADWRNIPGIAYRDGDNVCVTAVRPLIEDLDALPFQTRDTLPEVLRRGGPASLIGSRGCYGNCSFCSVNAFYRSQPGSSWRGRSPENIGEELEWLYRRMGADIIVFNDDNFIGPGKKGKERAYEIGEEILRRGLDLKFAIPAAVNDVDKELFGHLKRAGLRSVFLGVESMNQKDLKLYNKHTTVEQNEEAMRTLEELGVFYQIGFILLNPHSSLEDAKHNLSVIRSKILKNDYCGTQVFTGDLRILAGTALERLFKDEGFVHKERFHYTYTIPDQAVEQLREIIDQVILKKTFPVIVDCKEEFMAATWQRLIRTDICDLQLSSALWVVDRLENGGMGYEQMKQLIRSIEKGMSDIVKKHERMKAGESMEAACAPLRSAGM